MSSRVSKRREYGKVNPPNTIVCVEWIDASYQDGPIDFTELSGVFRMYSTGWLIRENDEHVSIGMDYVPENNTYRHVQHILKINIKSIREFTKQHVK